MAFEFKLPDVGEGLHEAELLKWFVKVGDVVEEDQPLMEVQTDKAAVEITSPTSGKVVKLMGKVGDILEIHSVVAVFDNGTTTGLPSDSEAATATTAAKVTGTKPEAKADVLSKTNKPAPSKGAPDGRALAAPATRKLARTLDIDINQVTGTGPAGRVTNEDVQSFSQGGGQAPASEEKSEKSAPATDSTVAPYLGGRPTAEDERLPLKGIRKIIAERMVKSKHTIPHVTSVDEVDLTALVEFRSRAKEIAAKKGVKLTFLPFFFKALTTALREFPYLNAQIDDEKYEIVLRKQYHLGFALDTDAGLLVPVIKDADKKSIFQIAAEMQTLIEKGKAGKLSPDELRGSTFSVSNQGSIGGLFFTPVINYPEVAILGIGQTQDRPVVRDGQIVIRKMAYLALAFDHRLIDGALATRFVNRVVQLLSDPALLMMEAM